MKKINPLTETEEAWEAAQALKKKREAEALQLWWPPIDAVGTKFGHIEMMLKKNSNVCGIAKGNPQTFEQFIADVAIADAVSKLHEWHRYSSCNVVYVYSSKHPDTAWRYYSGFRRFDPYQIGNPPISMHLQDDTETVRALFESGDVQVMLYDAEDEAEIALWPRTSPRPWDTEVSAHLTDKPSVFTRLKEAVQAARRRSLRLVW